MFQSTPPMQGATNGLSFWILTFLFQSTPPMQGATAISAKNSSSFSAEIDKLSFQILKFPLFHPLFVYKTRRLCTFKSANPPAFLCPLPIRTLILSQNQRIIHCNSTVNTHMFHFCLILISQIIESQAVNTLINNICQY